MVEEAGLETDGMAETTSQLQAKLKALTDGKVDIMVDANSFKNTTQILREMAAEWENLTDVEQAAALELLGGKRQANTLAAILSNFDIVEDAIEASEGSDGSALTENEKVLDSIEGKIQRFKNSTELFWSNLLDSDVIKMFVDLGTVIVELASKFGELESVIFAILMYFNMSKKYPFDLASIIFGPDGMNRILKGLGMIKNLLHSFKKTEAPLGLYPPGLPAPKERLALPAAQTGLVPYGPTSLTTAGSGALSLIDQMSDDKKTSFFANMINNARMAAQNIWQLFMNMINRLKTAAGNIFTGAFDTIKTKVGSFTNQIKKSYYKATNQAFMTDESGKVRKMDVVDRRMSVYGGSDSTDAKIASKVSQMWQNHMARLRDSIGRVKQDFSTVWQHHNERVAQSVQYASTQFNKLKASATSTFGKISAVTSNVANGIRNSYSKAADSVKAQVLSIRNAFVKATSKAYMTDEAGKVHRLKVQPSRLPTVYEQPEQSYSKVDEAINRIRINLRNTIDSGKWMFEDLASRVGYQFNKIKTNIGSAVSGTFNNIRSNVESSFNSTANSVSTAFNKIKSQFGGLTNKVKTSYYKATNQPFVTEEDGRVSKAKIIDRRVTAYEEPTKSYSKIKDTAAKVSAEVNRIWQKHISNLSGSLKSVQSEFTRVWNNHKVRVADSVAHAKSQFAAMTSGVSAQFATIRGKFSTAFSGITNVAKFVSTKVKSMFSKIAEPIVGGFQKATAKMKGFASDVSKSFKQKLGYDSAPISTDPSMFDALSQVQGKKLSIYDGGMTESSTAAIFDTVNQKAQQGQGVLQKYMTTMQGGNDALKAYIASLNGEQATMAGYNKFLQQHNASVKASGVAAKVAGVGHMFLNAALSMGVSFILSTAISAITSLINKNKELAESAKEAMTEIENMRKELKEHYDTIQEIKNDYADLADGVDGLGRNINLSTDEYKRYNEIVNQIASMFPEMVSGYTEEGNAIINLKGNVEALEEAYKKEAEAARDATLVKQNDVFDNFKNNTNKQAFSWLQMGKVSQTDKLSFFEAIMGGTSVSDWEKENKNLDSSLIDTWLEDAGIKSTNWYSKDADFDDAIQENIESIQAYYRTLKAQIEAEASSVRTVLNAYLQQDWDYLQMSDEGKKIAQSIISGFDSEFYSQFDSATEMEAYVINNVIKPLQNTSNFEHVELAFDLQTKFNNGQITVDEYIDQIEEMLKQLEPILGKEVVTTLRTVFGVEEENGTYETKKNSAKEILDSEGDARVGTLSKEDLDIIDKNKTKWKKEFKLDDDTLMSWEDLINAIQIAKDAAWEASEEFDAISEKIDSIQDAYSTLTDVVKQYNSTGYLTLDNLQALLSLEPEYLSALQMENGQLSINQSVLEAMIQTKLAEAKATAVQSAITELNALAARTEADAINASSTAASNAISGLGSYASALGIVAQDAIAAAGAVTAFNAAVQGAQDNKFVSQADIDKVLSNFNTKISLIDSVGKNLPKSFGSIVSPKSSGDKDDDKRLENLQKKYEGKIKNLENQKTWLENEIAREEEIGLGVSKSYYEERIKLNDKLTDQYEAQRKDLIALKDVYPEGSEKWYEVTDALWEVDHAIQDIITDSIKASKEIINLYNDVFSKIGEAYDDKLSISDDTISSMQNYAELLELQGGTATKGLYDAMIAENQNKLDTQWEKFNALNNVVEAIKAEENTAAPGSDEWEAFELERNKAIIAARAEQRQLKLDMQDTTKEIEQQKEEFKELATQLWDDVRAAYNNRDTYYQNQIALNDKYIEKLETLGINVPDKAYKAQIQSLEVAKTNAYKDYAQARQEMLDYEYIYGADSQEYIDKYNETIELHHKALDYENQILEKQQQIFDNQIDRFNQVIDRVTNATQRMQNISGLLEREDVATEDGEWTSEGLTRLGIAYQQMEYYKQSSNEIAEKMAEVTEAYENGEISEKKYYDTMQELENQQWDSINSYEDMKDAIIDMEEARIDMIEEGLNKEAEAYQELIDLKKEELEAERDLYDFKKDVEKQTKNIASLERRIASMGGSTDASTIAERTKLEAELRELKSGLDDTYYSHAMDSQSNALDDELDAYTKSSQDYIESLRESLKDTDLLIEQTYQKVVQNSATVLETIYGLSETYKFPIDQNLTDPWANAIQKSLDFETYAKSHIDAIYEYVNGMTGTLAESLGAPYSSRSKDEKGNPLYEFSWYAAEQINKIIKDNTEKQGAMKTSLDGGFTQSLETIKGWGSDAEIAVQGVINKFTDPETGLIAALNKTSDRINSMPNYDGGHTNSGTGGGGNSGGSGGTSNEIGSSEEVKALQEALNDVFGFGLTVDGKLGNNTITAIKGAQGKLGINADGKYGSDTRNAIIKHIDDTIEEWRKYNGSSMIGQAIQRYAEAKYKLPAPFYAKGTLGTKSSGFAITDESWIGEEITLAAGKNGQLQYLKKGSAVMPADISANLVEWGKLNPAMMNIGSTTDGINLMSNYINKPEIKLDIENFLNVGTVSRDTLPELEKLMDKKIDTFAKQLNASIRKFK